MAEDPQPLTLQQRIAALNAAHITRIPGGPPRANVQPTPSIPSRRPAVTKQHTINIPSEQVNGSINDSRNGNLPSAPPTLPIKKQPPPLPSRNKSSLEEERRGSVTSTTSTGTVDTSSSRATTNRTKSTDSASRVKAPAWGECGLPALPVKGANTPSTTRNYTDERPKYVNRAPSSTSVVTTVSITSAKPTPPPRPVLPPRVPSRKPEIEHREYVPDHPARKIPPAPSKESIERARKVAFAYTSIKEQPRIQVASITDPEKEPQKEAVQSRDTSMSLAFKEVVSILPRPAQHDPPLQARQAPPVPLSSRPDLAAIQATKPRTPSTAGTHAVSSTICMVCRDFSAPDHHASQFPRTQVSSLQTLAQQLTSLFQSDTDKARSIFAWLHYNISYDVVSFFGNNVKGSTPQSTLQTGLAVCEGYAALFTNLATHAGLESIVISGHGKGYGFNSLPPGAPLPPYNAGHAWNAVKIDHGEWKLIDACWGAGYVQGAGMPYIAKFNADYFTMSNEQFGVKHFPGNKDHFFLPQGRRVTWEEYIVIDPTCWPDMVEGPTIFTNAKEDYSIGEKTVFPRTRKINVRQGGMVHFQFSLLCPHWTLERRGPPPVFIVSIHGVDGREKDHVPLNHHPGSAGPGQGGDVWTVDIPARDLGAPGQTVTLFAVTSFSDRQDARGLSVQEFRSGKGRVGMGFVGVAAWDLV